MILIFIILLAPVVYPAPSTFTNCAQTGRTGPSQAQCNTAYSGTPLQGIVTVTSGIQYWTVPSTGRYTIEAFGAKGGGVHTTGAPGARMRGDFTLTAGTVLKILVGQAGASWGGAHGNENGGGGGTFVTNTANTPLIIAGGGGGGPSTSYGLSCARPITLGYGQTGTSGVTISCFATGTGGAGGGGGSTAGNNQGGGGGGLTGNGANGGTHCAIAYGGLSFTNGGVGGTGNTCYGTTNWGGFGGGGGGQLSGPGAAGGYSGGGQAGNWDLSSTYGGGGGSYNIGTSQSNSAGVNAGNGYVIITSTFPVISSVTDSPDPVNSGLPVKLSAYWTSALGLSVKLHACKTDSMTGTSCTSGYWCDTTAEWDSTSPSNCSYITQPGDNATTHDYYLFVCNSNSQCSPASDPNQGSFTVKQSTVLGVVESWLRIANNLIIGNTITIS